MEIIAILSVLLPVLAIAASFAGWQHMRANDRLERWARQAGVTLLSRERRFIRTGPMNHQRGQLVFRISARDRAGQERAGWVRVGGSPSDVQSGDTLVLWEDAAKSFAQSME